jgi:hypothetical protein
MNRVQHETSRFHRGLYTRIIAWRARIDSKIAVPHGLGQRHPGTAGAKVYRLRADDDDGVPMLSQRLQGIQHRGT